MSRSKVVRKKSNKLLKKVVNVGLLAKIDLAMESVIYRFLKDYGWLKNPARKSLIYWWEIPPTYY